jgi:hypothetical protein
MDLTLRKTVIGGETAEGDFTVIHDGRQIGRIRGTFDHVANTPMWSWNITVPLPMAAWCHGSADSLDTAKWAFKSAWERFYSSLTPKEIERWHHTQDARKP